MNVTERRAAYVIKIAEEVYEKMAEIKLRSKIGSW
jgi:3-methyladenine DNA glycosylase/8-oxoguanine DNA glycosylase